MVKGRLGLATGCRCTPYVKHPGWRISPGESCKCRDASNELKCILLKSGTATPPPGSKLTVTPHPHPACPRLSLDTASEASSSDLWKETGLGRQDLVLSSLLAANRCSKMLDGSRGTHARTPVRFLPKLSLCQVHPGSVLWPGSWSEDGDTISFTVRMQTRKRVRKVTSSTYVPCMLELRSPGPTPSSWEPNSVRGEGGKADLVFWIHPTISLNHSTKID